MSDFVLFSPLGMTDPTRGFRDGAFIHICRFYRPKKVYLYMSAEICGYDRLDNRYVKYLARLSEKFGFACEAVKIERPDLVNVSDFDAFYGDFTELIGRISAENPDCGILLNLSSGTPQMKSALQVVSSLSPLRLTLIQVLTPESRSNVEKPAGRDYEFELEWELNEDNRADSPPNRCREVKCRNLNAVIKWEIITKHIAAYDYKAALAVAETIPAHIEPRALALIRAGERRLGLDLGAAAAYARSAGYELLPVKDKDGSGTISTVFEYLLSLKIKLAKGELGGFIRALSPALTDLLEICLREKCGVDIAGFCVLSGEPGRQIPILVRDRLPPDLRAALDERYRRGYKDGPLSAASLTPLVACRAAPAAAALVGDLRTVEERARNLAAHEIVAVTDSWLKQNTGFTSEAIFKMLRKFLGLCVPIPRKAWHSYEDLNAAICGSRGSLFFVGEH